MNNPLNIRYSAGNNWKGQREPHNGFCSFDTLHNGLRAAAKLLRNYIELRGCNTIELIVSRWAPSNENNTENYIRFVSSKTKMPRDKPIRFIKSHIICLMHAMAKMESGIELSYDQLLSAYESAKG